MTQYKERNFSVSVSLPASLIERLTQDAQGNNETLSTLVTKIIGNAYSMDVMAMLNNKRKPKKLHYAPAQSADIGSAFITEMPMDWANFLEYPARIEAVYNAMICSFDAKFSLGDPVYPSEMTKEERFARMRAIGDIAKKYRHIK